MTGKSDRNVMTRLIAAEIEDTAAALDQMAETLLEGGSVDPFIEVLNTVGHQAAQGLRQLRADVARLRWGLALCEAQFRFYTNQHERAGKLDKASINRRFENMAQQVLKETKL